MDQKILEIDYKLRDLEASLPNTSEASIVEMLLQLRQSAFSNWIEDDPLDQANDRSTHVRDRIIEIEQRLLALASKVPAISTSCIANKLKLWMLFKDLPGLEWPSGDASDDLVLSVYMDLKRLVVSDSTSVVNPKPNLKWVS